MQRGVVSADGRVALIRLQYPLVDELSAEDLSNLKAFGAEAAAGSPLRIEMGGDLYFAFEQPQPGLGELIGLLVAALILFIAFGSLIATALPLGTAVLGLAIGVSSMSLIANVIDIPSWAPVLGAMVGLGVGIDYALFIVTRHRDYLARGVPVEESVGSALATAGKPVVVAGGIVVVAILGLAVAGVPFMTAGGIAISVVVLVMVGVSVTLLPALLGLAGHRINRRAHRPGRQRRRSGQPGLVTMGPARDPQPLAVRGGSHRALARSRRPGGGAACRHPRRRCAAGEPDRAPGLRPGGPGVRSGQQRAGGGRRRHGRRPGRDRPSGGGDQGRPGDRLGGCPGDARAGVAVIVAIPTTGPQDAATHATVERLRADVLPSVLAGSPAQAHVGGQTANFADVGARVNERLPVLIAAVLAMSFVLLMLVFRSVLVPLKAVVLNLLSIGAAYGVMVMVFQWGWAGGLIGLESTVPIVSFIPMFMFAILFGLSMDYEVFLLSRVREEYVATRDNQTSIVNGIASTGRVITSAALIMISVFLAFVLGEDAGHEDVRPRPGHGDLRGRHARAHGARAGDHDPSRRRQLVDPEDARPTAPEPAPRQGGPAIGSAGHAFFVTRRHQLDARRALVDPAQDRLGTLQGITPASARPTT